MLTAATSGALAADPWPSASSSTESSLENLSGACALLAILVQTQCASQNGSKTDIDLSAKKMEELKQQLADAIQHAKEASEHSGFLGFLGDIFGSDIAKIAGAVAAVAALVATGGAAAPLLLIAIAEALQVGAKVGAELGLDPKICMAVSLAGVAVGVCSGVGSAEAAGALANAARDVEVGAKIAESSSTIAGGALHGASGYYHGQQLAYQADVAGFQGDQAATSLTLDDAYARLERALRSEQRASLIVSDIVKNDADTNTALSNRI